MKKWLVAGSVVVIIAICVSAWLQSTGKNLERRQVYFF